MGLADKCLDVAGASSANGTRALGKCLEVASGSTADGAKVRLYDCNGTGAQQWSYNASTGDVVNLAADKCLDVTDRSSADGTRVQIWWCTGAANQKWQLR